MTRRLQIEGLTFGRLTVVRQTGNRKQGHPIYLCSCSCGGSTETTSYRLRSGHTSSCGCLRRERLIQRNTTHGMCGLPEYDIWTAIISRCYNDRDKDFRNYGGRSILMDENWKNSFPEFFAYIGPRPGDGFEIDRIDNSRGYFPGNVRWATKAVNSRNRRSNVILSYRGKTYCQKDAAKVSGIPEHVLIRRRSKGVTSEAELFAPVKGKKKLR